VELRPYQQDANQTILNDLMTIQFPLLQAPTGAGKTIMFSFLVKSLLEAYSMKILILAHREILITQTADKMRQVWPEIPVSIACASAGIVDFSGYVVVGSVQTVSRRVNELPMFDLVIIDEAHRLQPRGIKGSEGVSLHDSEYNTILERLLMYSPTTRVLGVTATPFRLGHGYIFGNKCKPGIINWFPGLTYQITMRKLMEAGALVPFRGLVADDLTKDLCWIRKTGGDFNEKQLSNVMSRTIHLDAAIEAYIHHGENRKHGVVFAVDIDHAKTLAERFRSAGISSTAIHSELSPEIRKQILYDFDAGRINMLVNVGILIEGWDCPKTDLVMFCRPTLAPALYIQMLGRGLRTFPGKTDCLLLDLAGNYDRHGHPDTPTVKIPKNRGHEDDDGMDEYDDVPLPSERKCDKCQIITTTRAWICPECGHILIPQADIPTLRQLKTDGTIAITDQMSEVAGCEVHPYRSKAGNDMVLCKVYVVPDKTVNLTEIQLYPDFSGKRALWWRAWWQSTIRTIPPRTNEEALSREWKLPKFATIRKEGNYWRIGTWIHA